MSRSDSFLDELSGHVLVGDGAIGTELLARGATIETGIERLNLLAPDIVRALHNDYIAAGSRVIETNTFSASVPALARFGAEGESHDVIAAGVRIARDAAAGSDVYVAGALGPLPLFEGERLDREEQASIFRAMIDTLLDGDVDILMFETFTDLEELAIAVSYARAATDKPVIAQMAFDAGGITAGGDTAESFIGRMIEAGANVAGTNCGGGVPPVIEAVTRMQRFSIPRSAYLNAGFPEDVEGRKVYLATPLYLAGRACQLVDLGVRLVGGCCGTGPDTIAAIAEAIATHCGTKPLSISVTEPVKAEPSKPVLPVVPETPRIPSGMLVELDPPQGLDPTSVIDAARQLKAAGIRHVTVADNPLASACADVVTIAGMIERETGLNVIPHLTGRDRNRIALQSALMGAHIQEIRSVLAVTGDPVRMYNETNTSGVFDLVSISLVQLIQEFNDGRRAEGGKTAFAIGVAFNPNVRNIEGQISKLRRKIDAGAHFVLTQPVFDRRKFDIMMEALADADIDLPLFPGILPLRSSKNAEFLHNEVPGIVIPEDIRNRLARYSSVADQRKVGAEVALEHVDLFTPHAHGIYLIAPRNRVDLVLPVIAARM